jgi:hypothetical protein
MAFGYLKTPGAGRHWSLLAVAAVVVAVLAILLTAGHGRAAKPITTASPARFQAMLGTRLRRLGLDYHWVACIPSGRSYRGVRIVRCNVDFGEPHIEAYCSVLRGGQLLTSQEDPAIPCGHDNAGMSTPVVTYN